MTPKFRKFRSTLNRTQRAVTEGKTANLCPNYHIFINDYHRLRVITRVMMNYRAQHVQQHLQVPGYPGLDMPEVHVGTARSSPLTLGEMMVVRPALYSHAKRLITFRHDSIVISLIDQRTI